MKDDKIAALIARFPTELPPGPCAFCGGEYAAHRIIDTILDRYAAGESAEAIIADTGEKPELVRAILAYRPLTQEEFIDTVMTAWENEKIRTREINDTLREIRRNAKITD